MAHAAAKSQAYISSWLVHHHVTIAAMTATAASTSPTPMLSIDSYAVFNGQSIRYGFDNVCAWFVGCDIAMIANKTNRLNSNWLRKMPIRYGCVKSASGIKNNVRVFSAQEMSEYLIQYHHSSMEFRNWFANIVKKLDAEFQQICADWSMIAATEVANYVEDFETVKCSEIVKAGKLNLNGFVIIRRASDGYINATQLCKAGGKQFNDWYRNERSIAFLNAFSTSAGIPVDLLINIISTGPNESRGTWVPDEVAIKIAEWICPAFEVQVSKWIKQLLITGHVELNKTQFEVKVKQIEDLAERRVQKFERKVLRIQALAELKVQKSEESANKRIQEAEARMKRESEERETKLKIENERLEREKMEILNKEFENKYEAKTSTNITKSSVYIACSLVGYRNLIFKFGVADNLKARFSTYNTGRSTDDLMHCVWHAEVIDAFAIEKLVFSVLQPWRLTENTPGAKLYNSKAECINMPLQCLISIVEATINRGQPAGLAESKRLADGKLFTAEATAHYHECRANPNAPANFKPIALTAAQSTPAAPAVREINAANPSAADDELLLQLTSKFVNNNYKDADPPCDHSRYRSNSEAFEVPVTAPRDWLLAQPDPKIAINKLQYAHFTEHLTSILDDQHLQVNPLPKRTNSFTKNLKSNVTI